MLQKGAGRKLQFTGQKRDVMDFDRKYDPGRQVSSPITENSHECFQTMMDSNQDYDEYVLDDNQLSENTSI